MTLELTAKFVSSVFKGEQHAKDACPSLKGIKAISRKENIIRSFFKFPSREGVMHFGKFILGNRLSGILN